jgi:aryl-alcohol dehydrogenase-like predicted oxidoreductase
METRILGEGLAVSAIGLGCMGFSHAYGAPTEKNEAVRLLRKAVDMGYTFFDTAECYIGKFADGAVSNNEELLGEALKPCRDHVVIGTKFGVRLEPDKIGPPAPDSRPEVIRSSVEGSLKRLQVKRIDLYYQHMIDPDIPAEDVAGVIAGLIQEGKIRHWGVSEADEDYIRHAHAVCPITAIQNRYSMMARHYEPLFPVLEELHIGYVAFSPMSNGFLTGKYDRNAAFDAKTDYRSIMPQYSAEGIEKTGNCLKCFTILRERKTQRPRKYPWRGCSARNRISFPSPVRARRNA